MMGSRWGRKDRPPLGSSTIRAWHRPKRRYVRLALESPAVYQLMFGGQIRPDEVELEQHAAAKDSFAALADIFQPDGAPYSETTTLRTHLVWAMVHGIASLRINGFLSNQSEGLDEITKSACRVLSKDWFRTGRSGR
jgi:hypothetical protein